MSSRTLGLISSNKRKVLFYEKALRLTTTDIRLVTQNYPFKELQSLQEIEVIQDKVSQALKLFKPPFIVDDEGFYITELPCFPGTLSKFVIQGMGWEQVLKLAQGKKVSMFCNIAFVNSHGQINVYSKSTTGTLIKTYEVITSRNTGYDFFVPAGHKLSLTQLETVPESLHLFPRYKVIEHMTSSKVFEVEYCRTKNTIPASDYI
jgi:inosine/xanthosine triphosphate pyrophosphatase family protein